MNAATISTKELRTELPRIRAGLAKGSSYTLIYRSKPIGHLQPVALKSTSRGARVKGGSLRLQANHAQRLTPEYLNELASQRY